MPVAARPFPFFSFIAKYILYTEQRLIFNGVILRALGPVVGVMAVVNEAACSLFTSSLLISLLKYFLNLSGLIFTILFTALRSLQVRIALT